MRQRSGVCAALCALAAAVLGGCANGHAKDPLLVMLDTEAGRSQRLAAAHRAGPVDAASDPDRYRQALTQIVWSDRQPTALRQLAVDRLIADDSAAFRREADQRITEIDDWLVLQHIFRRAAEHGWRDFTRTAVRNYARPSALYADRDRPEHELITTLHPGRSDVEILFDVFIGLDSDDTFAHQIAAWRVLYRLLEPDELRAWLQAAPPATALVDDLQHAAQVVDVLPNTAQGVLWLTYLRSAEGGQSWEQACRTTASLHDEQRQGLALRHLPLLLAAPSEDLNIGRGVLLAQVRRRLHDAHPVVRTDRVPTAWTESLPDHADRLAWADLLMIRHLLGALEDRALVAELFAQAEADRADTTAEHGGVLHHDPAHARWTATLYPPALRTHDRMFIAPMDLVTQMFVGQTHYHFHAQAHANAAYAAPGGGDLAFVDRFGAAAIVFTFIDRDTLNADYYQPDGLVIDLGTLHRNEDL